MCKRRSMTTTNLQGTEQGTDETIHRRVGPDALAEAHELWRLLRITRPGQCDMDLACRIARSFGWGSRRRALLLLYLTLAAQEEDRLIPEDVQQFQEEPRLSYSDRVAEAFAFALHLHRHQDRKGTTVPYVTHLMAVAALVGSVGESSA